RWNKLRTRAEGLEGFGKLLRASRDRRRLNELREATAEIEDELEVLRLETLAVASSEQEAGAVVRAMPIGPGSEAWADALIGMSSAWAERTGRAVTRLDGDGWAVRISGPGTFGLLCYEEGLHRRRLPNGTTLLARIAVSPGEEPPDPVSGDEI